jgi:hypothetical protein
MALNDETLNDENLNDKAINDEAHNRDNMSDGVMMKTRTKDQ